MAQTTMKRGTAVVTGAAGGMGGEYAKGLAVRGYDLLLVDRPGTALSELAAAVAAMGKAVAGRSVQTAAVDLADPKALDTFATRLEGDGSITLLANLATAVTFSPFTSIGVSAIDQTIAVNITAVTRLSRAVVPNFVARGSGTIVNFASVLAFHPWPEMQVYNAAKAYVVAFSQALQGELADKGVLVQVVSPPATATPFWQHAGFAHENFPPQAVMTRDDLVKGALAGLDQGEPWVFPSLSDPAVWDAYQGARNALVGGMMRGTLAERYATADAAA
jgi:uncharacterized protein